MAEIYTVECSESMQRCATGNTALEQIGHNAMWGKNVQYQNSFSVKLLIVKIIVVSAVW